MNSDLPKSRAICTRSFSPNDEPRGESLVRGRRASMAGMTITVARDGGRSSMARYSPPVIILIALLCAGVIPPFVFLAYSSLHELDPSGAFGAFTFGHFAAIFSSRTFGSAIVNSAVYSSGLGAARAGDRRDPGLARGADRRFPAAGSLCVLDRIARHSLRSLYRCLDFVPRQSRSGQCLLATDVRRH